MFKKLKKALTVGTVFTAAANMHACVYGPPPSSDSIVTDQNTVTTVKTTDFDPSENEQPCVYGPPSDFGMSEPEDSYDPSDNQNEDVYGPPEDFDLPADDNESEEDIDVPDSFDPEDNLNVCVYGPPEAFE